MSVNKVILIGNVGSDPAMHYPEKDKAVAVVSLATNSRYGDNVEVTDWHRILFYNEMARIVERYVVKGTKLYVEGRITYRNYTDKMGISRKITEIIAENMELLGRAQSATVGD
ncbi:MAG: single-stranded DNA-binding protein [Muribaculum sp.]|nr:single-stranded DNA-binding protein [Muribaculum sp.]